MLVFVAAPARALDAQRVIPGLDASAMDPSVRPGDDFYQYANGNWVRRAQIPPELGSYGAFNIAAKQADANVAAIVHGAAIDFVKTFTGKQQSGSSGHAAPGSDLRKVADFYRAFLDTVTIRSRGMAPMRPALDSIAGIASKEALARYLGAHLRADVDPMNNAILHTDNPFGLWVAQDFNHPGRNVAFLLQGGIEMPDRSYYLDTSPAMANIRAEYRSHVARMLALAHVAAPEATADSIIALERRIARTHWKVEDSEDPAKGNNHWARADFARKAPGLNWPVFFAAARLSGEDSIVAWQPSAIAGISALVGSDALETWKDLLAYHVIEDHASVLPAAFDREAFAFFGKTLGGAEAQDSRDKRAVAATSDALGFIVGKEYAARYFPPAAKANARKMVAGIIAAFQHRIDALSWMAPSTKAEAKAKLATLRVGIGYPDKWPSYAGLTPTANQAYENADRVTRFRYAQAMADLRRPVDHDMWVMTPQTVNAVNMPAMNALNFPAAILQPPFFDANRADAMNYGGIGAVIGHEISHSFDNGGATFDSRGRMRNWWTPADFAHFKASTQALARQYDAYHPLPDLAINGEQTLSENIADLAGITASYDAFHASLGGAPARVVAGLTGDQQFFLSFAQIWRTKFREAALRRQLLTNGHSPGPWRALTVRNLDPWYAAFGVKPGEKLYLTPATRVRIW